MRVGEGRLFLRCRWNPFHVSCCFGAFFIDAMYVRHRTAGEEATGTPLLFVLKTRKKGLIETPCSFLGPRCRWPAPSSVVACRL